MFTTQRLIVIALCAALNFSIGSIVYLVKLPVYFDSVGTILCALLIWPDRTAAFVCCLVAALVSTLFTGLLVNPFLPWFVGTDVVICLCAAYVAANFGDTFRARPMNPVMFGSRVLIAGIVMGVAAAIVSAPVVVYLFGGVTGSGSAFIVAFFLKTGEQLWKAVLLSGLTADPVDKTLQVLVSALLFRATPSDFIAMVRGGTPARA
jgi:energy-coupling factor transport system substrate-specific component